MKHQRNFRKTLEKISLGALFIKASLREADKSFILRGLLYISKLDKNSKSTKIAKK
ncbi:conjugal transfer protein TraD [Bartonella sp. CM100XJJH]|uniref:conjugal transfer protein TraD n=1 Tax=Bartonella sp. CM100XJJH TaxID=3243543 RepID=UPI0035D0A22D